jgi:hypothetical protein
MRIDYTLLDRSLLPRIQKGVDCLRCCSDQTDHHLTEEAALAAATANGRFTPVSFEGGGIQEASMEALNTQFGEPHTGMIYTPPSFSDHIAISLLTDASLLRSDLVLDAKDAATKKAQPHKLQTTIASFFGSASATRGSSSNSKSRVASSVRPATGNVAKKAKVAAATTASSKKPKTAASASAAKAAPAANSILNHFRRNDKSA